MRVFWIALLAAGIAAAETDEKALAWLHKAQERAGGAETLEAVRDILLERQLRSVAAGVTATQTVRYTPPTALRQESALPFGKLVVFVNADGGWMNGPQGLMDLPAPQLRQARGELFRLREALLLADRLGDREVRFLREAEEDGRQAVVLQIRAKQGDETAEIWIDKDSADFYKLAYQGIALAGKPPRVEERYSDFRQIQGIRIPHKTSIYQAGALATDVTIVEAALNTGATEQDLAAKS